MRITHCKNWNTEKKNKEKKENMENTPSKTWNILSKLTNEEHEKCTRFDMEYGKKKKTLKTMENEK